jgi:hypothetical protein
MEWLILLLVLAVALVAVAVVANRSRSTALRERFGAEYDRAVEEHGDRRKAEAGLRAVAKRRAELDIRPLSAESRDRYVLRWRDAQARFVDAPVRALAEADSLVGQVLRERGYPTGDFDEQAALVAADHRDRADDYRRAFATHRGVEGDGTTDDLREAFLRYRSVFEALVAEGPAEPAGSGQDAGDGAREAGGDGQRGEAPTWGAAPYDGQHAEARRREAEMARRQSVERRVSSARAAEGEEDTR